LIDLDFRKLKSQGLFTSEVIYFPFGPRIIAQIIVFVNFSDVLVQGVNAPADCYAVEAGWGINNWDKCNMCTTTGQYIRSRKIIL
jgi:hypothetical protein